MSPNPISPIQLIGQWAYKGPEGTARLTISQDGTWRGTATTSGGPEASFEGHWMADKDYIYWVYSRSSTPMKKVGTKEKDRIVAVGADFIELHTFDDQRRRYIRAT